MNDRKDPDPSVVRRARKTATMFGVMGIFVLIAYVCAFVQRIAAEENAALAKVLMEQLIECREARK